MRRGTLSVLSILIGVVAGSGTVNKMERDKLKKSEKMTGKFSAQFYMMTQWVKVKQGGKSLSSYFEENKYKKIAIYGMSHIGETLLEELKGTGIEVSYGIDRRVSSVHTDIEMVSPDDLLDSVDAIVVTVIDCFDEIEERLRKKVECPIVSIEDVVFAVQLQG